MKQKIILKYLFYFSPHFYFLINEEIFWSMILMKENFFPSDTNAYLQEKKVHMQKFNSDTSFSLFHQAPLNYY